MAIKKGKFPNISNSQFVHFGYRAEPFFVSSVLAGGYSNPKNLKKYFGLNNPLSTVFAGYEMFNLKTSLENLSAELNKKLRDSKNNYISGIVKGCYRAGDRLLKVSKEIRQASQKPGLSKQEMIRLLKKYQAEAYHYCIYYIIAWFEKPEREAAQAIAKKYTNSQKDFSALLSLITTPARETAAEHEQDDFLKLRSDLPSNKIKLEKLVAAHAQKYGWLSIRYFIGEPWTSRDVLNRLQNINQSHAKALLKSRLENRKKIEANLKLGLTKMAPKDQRQVREIREIIFLRTQRADFYHHSSYYVQPLAKKIAQTLNVNYSDFLNFSPDEAALALAGKFNIQSQTAARRQQIVTFHRSGSAILAGQAAKTYINKRPALKQIQKKVSTLNGQGTFAGKVTGRVKIVLNNQDTGKVQKGDVLVTTMTTPNFIAAMERAAAFVTNEGGILCHAAIVSREMKKPCVIGTKIATKVFKDGDRVEVNANKGLVRKI